MSNCILWGKIRKKKKKIRKNVIAEYFTQHAKFKKLLILRKKVIVGISFSKIFSWMVDLSHQDDINDGFAPVFL